MAHTTRRTDPRAAKARDIARSVLPSSGRHRARKELDGLRRRHRHHANARARAIRTLPCLCTDLDDVDLFDTDLSDDCPRCDADPVLGSEYPLSDHLYAISDRRENDKVGPLLRWGARYADGLAPDEAEHRLRTLVPDGVIGAHAITHLRAAGILRNRYRPTGEQPDHREQEPSGSERLACLGRVADAALDQSLLGRFHEVVRAHSLRSSRIRTVWPHRHVDQAFPTVETQDRHDLAARGFRQLDCHSSDIPGATPVVRWWRPLGGRHDRDDWVTAYHRCGHPAAVDRMLVELSRLLQVART